MQNKNLVDDRLNIMALKNGTVIDHIPSDETLDIMEILKLSEYDETVTIAFNLESKLLGKKGMIKIASKQLTQSEINKIALLAPHATMNIIENFRVKEKIKIQLPESVKGFVKCPNPRCITNLEEIETKFHIEKDKKGDIKLRCNYCERTIDKDEISME